MNHPVMIFLEIAPSPRLHSIALIDCIVCHDHMQKYPFSNQNSIIMKYCISKDVAQETLRFDT